MAEEQVPQSMEAKMDALIDRMLPGDVEVPVNQVQEQEVAEEAPAEQVAEAAPETYEFEWNGGKYQVPPELKEMHEGYQRQQDYTKKTTEVADLRRTAEARALQIKHEDEMREALKPHHERMALVNLHLQRIQNTDWNKLLDENPVEAQKQMFARQQVLEAKAQIEAAIKVETEKHGKGITEARAKLVEEGAKILERDIKGWSPEKASALNTFARTQYGFTEPEIAEIVDPRWVKMAHDASQWQQLQASKPQVANKVAAIGKTLKPQASQAQDSNQEAELKRAIRSSKTDSERAIHVAKLIESRLP